MRALWPLILCAVMQTAVHAQQQPPKIPVIEPAELHGSTRQKAMIEMRPDLRGRWDILPFYMPINPVHVALMYNGKVLIVSGSGNDADNKNFQAAVWDPKDYTIRTFTISWDMFCNGMVVLPDGRPFILGGTLEYDTPKRPLFLGEPRTAAFDPSSETFVDLPKMSGGRWYPTGTVLGDGSVLVYSGSNDTDGLINPTVQIWTGSSFIPAGTAFESVQFYPREHLLPNGKVFVSGWNRDSQIYDPITHTFTKVAYTQLDYDRVYGTSVLLPLTPANGFNPKVMILGGGDILSGRVPRVTETTELIDLSVPKPVWVWGPAMAKPSIQLNATILPDGKVLVSGGSEQDEDAASAVKEAQLYDPESNSFASASWMEFPRLYHSTALLLPDAKVAVFGGNPQRKVYQPEIEIYSPPYLFKADRRPAKRPAITSVPTAAIGYGTSFQVRTPDAANIKSIVLIRTGAVTHAFDMEQRLVGLSFTAGPDALEVKAPATGDLAPPGYYLLFILNSEGVPSVGQFVRLSPMTG
jgi:hypothetical protein